MLTTDQVARFQADGFLRGSRLLDQNQIDELREETMRVIRDRDDQSKPQPVMVHNMTNNPNGAIWQIVNIWEASEPFRTLIHNETLVAEVAQLTGARELRVWHDQIQYKPASGGGVNRWHQDHPYWGILNQPTQVTAWIALDDVDAENGCMSMVPGSHHWGNQIELLHKVEDFNVLPEQFGGHKVRARLCPVGAGAVHYHHALTWHGSHANTSPRPRRAIAIHYMTEATRYDTSRGHPMKPFVTVADGQKLQGEHFPLVWSADVAAAV